MHLFAFILKLKKNFMIFYKNKNLDIIIKYKKIRDNLNKNYIIYFIYYYYIVRLFNKKKFNLKIPTRYTFLCVEGFPRSGNSFVSSLTRLMFHSQKVVSHSHNINVIKKSLKMNIKCIILIRNPVNCIISLLRLKNETKFYKNKKLICFYLSQYLSYYSYVNKVKNHKNVLLINIENITYKILTKKIYQFTKSKTKTTNYKIIKTYKIFKKIKDQAKTFDISKKESYSRNIIKKKLPPKILNAISSNSKMKLAQNIFTKINTKINNDKQNF